MVTILFQDIVPAQTVNVYHVPWNATDATLNIQSTIDEAVAPSKVILDVHPTPWYTGPIFLRQPNQQIWFADGAKVMALAGSYLGTRDCMFTVTADNVKINGYCNGTSTAAGITTLEMRKSDYQNPPYAQGEWRHGISIRGAKNTVVKGCNILKSGGDGIYVANSTALVVPYRTTIQDVVSDGNNRQGISIISANLITVTNSIFKNTNGTAPQSGVDIEPNLHTDILRGIHFVSCQFLNNTGDNIGINLRAQSGPGLSPVDIRFESCLVDGGPRNGFVFTGLAAHGPTGTIVVENTTIKNTTSSGLYFGVWAADRVGVTMRNVDLYNCNPSGSKPPILWTQTTGTIPVHGDVIFQSGCHITDFVKSRTTAMVYAGANVRAVGLKDITGAITVTRPRTSTGPLLALGGNTTNCTLTVTEGD